MVHIRRQDGMYLTGGGTMQIADKPGSPYADLTAACEAINRYKFMARLYNWDEQYDSFIFEHISD